MERGGQLAIYVFEFDGRGMGNFFVRLRNGIELLYHNSRASLCYLLIIGDLNVDGQSSNAAIIY